MTVMYGSKYGVLWILLLVVLFVSIPLSAILRRRGLTWWKILPMIASTVVTVRLSGDGASAPPTEPPETIAPGVRSAPEPGLGLKDPGY